jgi:hypothetical protein
MSRKSPRTGIKRRTNNAVYTDEEIEVLRRRGQPLNLWAHQIGNQSNEQAITTNWTDTQH